jgi:hypothetical protein
MGMRPKINNKSDYFLRHFQLSINLKQFEAWQQVEAEYKEDNGKSLYSTFESFRVNKSIFYNNKSNR